jgi:predicted anti-sigma-YlaC factor YlaD
MSVEAGITCQEVVELLNDYLEGELPTSQRVRVEEHLAGCDGCTIILDEFRETIRLMGMLAIEHVRESQRATLLEAFRGWSTEPDHRQPYRE